MSYHVIRARRPGGRDCTVKLRSGGVFRLPMREAPSIGFSLKPPKKLRRAFRRIKKAITLKRVLKAGVIVGGAVYGGPLLLKGGGILARKAGGLIRRARGARGARGEAGSAEIPGTAISAPMSAPVEYAQTPQPEFAAPGGGGGDEDAGDELTEARPAAAGAGSVGGIPAPLLIGGLILATMLIGKASAGARARR